MNAAMAQPIHDDSAVELERLADMCASALRHCRRLGADQSEVSADVGSGLEVGVRGGEVETLVRKRDRGLSVTVQFGQSRGSASTADLEDGSLLTTVEKACAIARRTEADACNGLADSDLYARQFPDLDLWHPWNIDPQQAIALACEMEAAGRDVDARITNSTASLGMGARLSVLANSGGFLGKRRASRHSLSCVQIASDAHGMQRDHWYSAARSANDLQSPVEIGRQAAQRAVSRLGARSPGTRQCPVLFVPDMAKTLLAEFVAAASGGALHRNASFLGGCVGKPVFPDFVRIDERPLMRRGPGSAHYDDEGVARRESALVVRGVLQRYLLDSYSARKLGMVTTGNAGGVSNLEVSGGGDDFQALLRRMGTGLVVTEAMGQGVSLVSGDYSRGASGFWVENGQVAYPVAGITIASNLRQMFAGVVAVGADIDRRSSLMSGSLLIERMTVAGK